MTKKVAHNDIQLVDIDSITGAAYNPRVALEDRLKQMENSLLYLGFVLPLYINQHGVLLSGHQRTKVAKHLGYTKVPVVRINVSPKFEKSLNVWFNKATNDMGKQDSAKQAFIEFMTERPPDFSTMKPIEPDSEFPCLHTSAIELAPLLVREGNSLEEYEREVASGLIANRVYMPLVLCGEELINGLLRMYAYHRGSYSHVDAVQIPPEKANYARLALNFLAMDFRLQDALQDELRYNAYRRIGLQKCIMGLSRGFSFPVYQRVVPNMQRSWHVLRDADGELHQYMPNRNPEALERYRKTYGERIIDFGAGTFHDAAILREAGFKVAAFEPYCLPPDAGMRSRTPACVHTSRTKVRQFLEDLVEMEEAESLVSSFVLNSVPHHKDRMVVLAIMSSLCKFNTTAYITTQSVKAAATAYAPADMEPNMYVGQTIGTLKVQKFFYPDELRKMLEVFWGKVDIKHSANNLVATCRLPKRPHPQLLKEALEFEFNLPFSTGETLNLVAEAKQVFSSYVGIKIT